MSLAARTLPGASRNLVSKQNGSRYQRLMIADINTAYQPDLILLDGVEAFTQGGPDTGWHVRAEVVLAGTDWVAADAVGVAILRDLGTTER